MRVLITLSLALSLAVCPAVFAAGWYLGAGIGISEIEDAGFDEIDTGWKIFGGIPVNQYFAIEAAYMDFGNPQEDFFGIKGEYEIWALGAWAKGILPVNPKFELFAKAGFFYWELDATRSLFGSTPVSVSDDGTDFAWGLGATFNASDKFSIQLEYENVDVDIDKAVLWTVAGVFHF